MAAVLPSLAEIEAWGVVGAGGAGFPTHVKLKASADTVLLNAAECEPLLHKDKELLRHYPDEVLEGLEIARAVVGAAEAIVGVKHKYADVIALLSRKAHGHTRVVELTDTYPAGDEFILVYDITGRIIPPGKLPLHVGCVVVNVETVLNIARARPVTGKYLTVAGAVKSPSTVYVPVGTRFDEAIRLAGGATAADPVVLVGGAMMGQFCDDLSTPVTKTTGGLIVLSRDHPLVHRYTLPWKAVKTIGASACDQCTFCTLLCPRYLLGHPVEPHKAMRSLGFNLVGEPNIIGSLFCCECNLCTMIACPEDLDPKTVIGRSKHQLLSEGRRWDTPAEPHRAELNLDNRRVPIPRLIRKLGLHTFVNEGPLLEERYRAGRVVLPLKQHAGTPAEPRVQVGHRVAEGDLIAVPPAGRLGARLHASIGGSVVSVDGSITIEA